MSRLLLVATGLLALALQARAQDAKPNTLTPKEIADGWILLFDGETTFGWNVKGDVRAERGALNFGGKSETVVRFQTHFQDYEISLEMAVEGKNAALLHGPDRKGIHYFGGRPQAAVWRPMRIKAQGGRRIFDLDNNRVRVDVTAPPNDHRVPVWEVAPDSVLKVRNVKLKPLDMQSLFNGKDLAGWKIFPGKKSEFAVIDGAINIKDGPGDLQTEKQFGDFLLQLECISHGKHLNSGVFFRCRPNEYQNGYEAQVRNQFTEKPTQKYLLEEYDAETHKLLGKKETLFTAVDFGTGAIYRRQPARKEMSKDGEWLTMTVVAHGNHIATWVNGVQVTDWFDHRPRTDNARTGCRLEAGHISLQGHDPTTNLSFRNFRIQEYPAAK